MRISITAKHFSHVKAVLPICFICIQLAGIAHRRQCLASEHRVVYADLAIFRCTCGL